MTGSALGITANSLLGLVAVAMGAGSWAGIRLRRAGLYFKTFDLEREVLRVCSRHSVHGRHEIACARLPSGMNIRT